MEVKGKIVTKLPPLSGVSKAGTAWKKQEYVLETIESYPKKIHFDFFGDRSDQYQFEEGDYIELSFDIESREFNGRWYTSIRGWKAVKIDAAQAAAQQPVAAPAAAPAGPAPAGPAPAAPAPDFSQPTASDDLPF